MKRRNVMIATTRLIVTCAIMSLLITACSTSPPVRYFSLSSTVADGGKGVGERVVLGLGPMRMAEYLTVLKLLRAVQAQKLTSMNSTAGQNHLR